MRALREPNETQSKQTIQGRHMIPSTVSTTTASNTTTAISTTRTTATPLRTAQKTPLHQAGTAFGGQMPMIQPRANGPVLLNLALDLGSSSNRQASEDVSGPAPGSPPRAAKKGKRGAVEKHSRKRPIDSADGPTSEHAVSSKRQKESTPPTSPRGSGAGGKQMIRSPRALADVRAAAGLPLRGAGTASPPLSPRSAVMDDRLDKNGEPTYRASSTQPDPASSWTRPVIRDRPGSPAHGGLTLSPRRGSLAGSNTASLSTSDPARVSAASGECAPGLLRSPTRVPAILSTLGEKDFEFSDFDNNLYTGYKPAPDTDSAALIAASTSLSTLMIRTELSGATKALAESFTTWFFAMDSGPVPAASSSAASAQTASETQARQDAHDAFDREHESLQAKLILANFAFDMGDLAYAGRTLAEILDSIAACLSALNRSDSSTVPGPAAVRSGLDQLATACRTGLAMLADEETLDEKREPTDTTSTATTASTTLSRMPLTLSTELLLDDLSALMDEDANFSQLELPASTPEAKE